MTNIREFFSKKRPYVSNFKQFLILKRAVQFGLLFFCFFVLPYYGFLWWAHDFNPRFVFIDNCLDRGGKWHYEINVCEEESRVFIDRSKIQRGNSK